MEPSGEVDDYAAMGKDIRACRVIGTYGPLGTGVLSRAGRRMIYDGWNLFVQSPEGCLLVWENEESNVEESVREKRPKSV